MSWDVGMLYDKSSTFFDCLFHFLLWITLSFYRSFNCTDCFFFASFSILRYSCSSNSEQLLCHCVGWVKKSEVVGLYSIAHCSWRHITNTHTPHVRGWVGVTETEYLLCGRSPVGFFPLSSTLMNAVLCSSLHWRFGEPALLILCAKEITVHSVEPELFLNQTLMELNFT